MVKPLGCIGEHYRWYDLLEMDLPGFIHVLPFLPRLSWVDLACTGVFAVPTLRKLLTASLASLLLDTFYKGLGGPHHLLEKNI